MSGPRGVVTWNQDYPCARPAYPPALFGHLASLCPASDLAWDCGTGTGQAAVPLAECFDRVVATDAQPGQLSRAEPHPRVVYARAKAERAPLPAASVDLVAVAQALHWFDRPAFYAEADRALRPGGLLAAWCFFLPTVAPGVDAVVARLYHEVLKDDWPPEVREVEDGYARVRLPFDPMPPTRFEMVARWELDRFALHLGTWSAAERHEARTNRHPIQLARGDLEAAWGEPGATREVRWEIVLRAARKPLGSPIPDRLPGAAGHDGPAA